MHALLYTDWSRLFRPEMSLPEILIRGSLVYITLCVLLRIILKRQAGKLSLSDILVVSIVAGVCRNPLVRDAYSIPDGMAVVGVVLAWSYALDWLSYHSAFAHRLLHPEPVVLIREGTILHANLRRELMTERQLLSQLRQNGVNDPTQVAEAVMEGSGQVSVIRKRDDSPGTQGLRSTVCNGITPRQSRTPGEAVPGRSLAGGAPCEPQPVDCTELALSEGGEFLRVADRLYAMLAWHERQITAHQQAMEDIKKCFGRPAAATDTRPNHSRRE